MNADFIFSQLRVAAVAFIAYAGGKGWFTPADATLATALLSSLGPIAAPWLASLYATYGTKKVPESAVAVEPTMRTTTSLAGDAQVTGKIVGGLMLAFLFLYPISADAATKKKPAPVAVKAEALDLPALLTHIDLLLTQQFAAPPPTPIKASAAAGGLDFGCLATIAGGAVLIQRMLVR